MFAPPARRTFHKGAKNYQMNSKDLATLKNLLDAGLNPNEMPSSHSTLLMNVAQTKPVECVQLLLDRGADLHWRNQKGVTALWPAVANGRVKTVRLLLELGADFKTPDCEGDTVLMLACRNGEDEDERFTTIVHLLLDLGAEVNTCDNEGWTALTWASAVGHITIARLLVERGAGLNPIATYYGTTPLIRAVQIKSRELVKLLVEHGADVTLRDREGKTAQDWALKRNFCEVEDLLA